MSSTIINLTATTIERKYSKSAIGKQVNVTCTLCNMTTALLNENIRDFFHICDKGFYYRSKTDFSKSPLAKFFDNSGQTMCRHKNIVMSKMMLAQYHLKRSLYPDPIGNYYQVIHADTKEFAYDTASFQCEYCDKMFSRDEFEEISRQ